MRADKPVIAVTFDSVEFMQFVLWKDMFRGIVAAGGVPVAVDCGTPREDLKVVLYAVDGLLISGGVDVDPQLYGGDRRDPLVEHINPARDHNELTALHLARDRGIPVLAICRGAQLVNVALGGTLYADLARDQASETKHMHSEEALARPLHTVNIEPETLLAGWAQSDGAVAVNSQHHQGIKALAGQARASAHSQDDLVEAFEIPDEKIVAVQWHPEVLWRAEYHALNLLKSFAAMCTPEPGPGQAPVPRTAGNRSLNTTEC